MLFGDAKGSVQSVTEELKAPLSGAPALFDNLEEAHRSASGRRDTLSP